MTYRYRYCGNVLESRQSIHALTELNDDVCPDIIIEHINLKHPSTAHGTTGPNWQVREDEAWWWLQDRVFFRIRPDRIDIYKRDIGYSLVHALLLEAPMVMAMIFRGQFCLNAASALKDDQPIVFCGTSGGGRSTAAARLTLNGGKMITDSLARIDTTGHPSPRIIPQESGSLLWPDSLRSLGIDEALTESVRTETKIRRVRLDATTTSLPIGRIYWHNPYPVTHSVSADANSGNEPSIRQRFKRLALITSGRMWIDPAGKSKAHFRWCISLAQSCRIEQAPLTFFER